MIDRGAAAMQTVSQGAHVLADGRVADVQGALRGVDATPVGLR